MPETGIGVEKKPGIISKEFSWDGLVVFFTQVFLKVKAVGNNTASLGGHVFSDSKTKPEKSTNSLTP